MMDQDADNRIQAARDMLGAYLSAAAHPDGGHILDKAEGMAAIITDELGLGALSEAACYLSKPFNDGWLVPAQVGAGFSTPMLRILEGLKKIDGLNTSRTKIHADKFIQLLLSISEDVRVILIKTGERLFALRNIARLEPDEQLRM
ncbi:MAG: HD domain-containing protein, partial [Bacteroidales bacterium]